MRNVSAYKIIIKHQLCFYTLAMKDSKMKSEKNFIYNILKKYKFLGV